MLSSSSILLFLCTTLVYTKQVPIEYGTNQEHNVNLPSDKKLRSDDHETDLLRTNLIETNKISTRQSVEKDTIPTVKSSYVHLPVDQIRCNVDQDCDKHNLPLRCGQDGLCECVLKCWTYYTDTTQWPVVNVFTCDTCGLLGSSCNATSSCDEPGACMADGYCHCRHSGEHDENGICWIANTNWAMMIAVCAMGIILVFAIMVTAYNLYVTRPWRNGCGRRRPTPDVLHQNETDRDTMKTPAYSVRDYYGYTPVELPQDSSQPVQADGEIASTSSSSAVIDNQTASTSSRTVVLDDQIPSTSNTISVDYDIQENNHSKIDTPIRQDTTESIQQEIRCRINDSSAESSARSSLSSTASTVNSERPLVSASGNNSAQDSGFSISRVFNRGQSSRDDYSDSTRF